MKAANNDKYKKQWNINLYTKRQPEKKFEYRKNVRKL